MKTKSKLLFNYCLVIFSANVMISISTIMQVLGLMVHSHGIFNPIAIISGSMTGFCIGIARLSNKKLLLQLRRKLFKRENYESKETSLIINRESLADPVFLGEYFENITKKVFFTQTCYQVFVMVYLKFGLTNNNASFIFDTKTKYTDYKFTENEYKEMITPDFGNTYYQKCNKKSVYLEQEIIREYMPKDFAYLRVLCGVSDDEIQQYFLVRSMALPKNSKNMSRAQGGASASFIFTTYDEKFVLKTITLSEKKYFLKLLGRYIDRLNCNQNSKLVRILGLFKLIPENLYFLIMENIVPKKKSAVLFDLKGSSIDRLIENIDYNNLPLGTVLKDENFRICGLKIEIPEEVAEEIIDVLKGDFEMLNS